MQKKISIVFAIYNEEENIARLCEEVRKVVDKENYDFDILFVDDGSKDKSVEIIKNIIQENNNIKLIKLTRNFGHQQALTAGVELAEADAIITMDADLQDPPSLIPDLIKKWEEGYKVVYAQRKNYRRDNIFKRIMTKLYYKLIHRMHSMKIPQNVGDYRLIDKTVQAELLKMQERSRYLRGMVAWLGFEAAFVPYHRKDREEGKSSYSFAKLISLGMDGLINFSMIPLRFGLYLGFMSIFIGVGFLAFMLIDIAVNDVYYHLYKFLVDIIFIFLGFLFILIWILGEYIGRTYRETKGRSIYVIDSKENFSKE